MARVKAIHGDSRVVLKTMPDAHFHAVITDPPYSLVSIQKRFGKPGSAPAKDRTGVYRRASAGFMGASWDTGETAFDPEFWAEVCRVLRPGGHLLAFGGTRTYHRLTCAIEDGGFEVRDAIMWHYGQGFPKSHDAAKAMDKHLGTPGRTVAQGDPVKRMIPGADQNKTGWKKDNGREYQPGSYMPGSDEAAEWEGWGTALKPATEIICMARKPLIGTVAANLAEHRCGAINVDACRIATADNLNGGAYAEVGGRGVSGSLSPTGMNVPGKTAGKPFTAPVGRWPANVVHDGSEEVLAAFPDSDGAAGRVTGREASTEHRYILSGLAGRHVSREPRGDSGSAARFFYSAKADASDRLQSKHPTVKPVDLMRWLVRLVTPKGGHVLDPFAGSGTTGMACMAEGFDCTLIEKEAEYAADIERRIKHVDGADTPLFNKES